MTETQATQLTPFVRPTGTSVVVRRTPISRERTQGEGGIHLDVRMSAGGVAIPDSIDNYESEGVVIALGDGYEDACPTCWPQGKRHVFESKIGDRVMFQPWAAVSIILDGEEVEVVDDRDILAVMVD